MTGIVDFVTAHATLLVAALAVIEAGLCLVLSRRNSSLQRRLITARAAAEDAARFAALAAPGSIDPEVVIHLLRTGQSPTLENVSHLMEVRDRGDVADAGSSVPG